jgi:hypothetical protein
MSFFDTVDDLGIVESHIKKLETLEESESKELLKRYREIRQELRDRLDRLPPDSFTAQQLRIVLLQMEMATASMGSSMKDRIRPILLKMTGRGLDDLVSEIQAFSEKFTGAGVPINVNRSLVAEDASNFLVNRFETSIDAYSADVRKLLTMQISQAALEQVPLPSLVGRLSRFLIGEEWKLLRIARTELHHVYGLGKLKGMEAIAETTLPDLQKTLIHPMDSRTADDSKQLANLNPVVDIDKPFRFTYTRRLKNGEVRKDERVFMVPPDRPNDRSVLVPYRKIWER